MKPRHAAALMLFVLAVSMAGCERRKPFWLLMEPPVNGDQIDKNAPIKNWTLMYHPFGSLSKCFNMEQFVQYSSRHEPLNSMPQKMTLYVTCVSSNDPRLKGD